MRAFFGTVLIVGGLWIVWPSLGTPDAKMKAFSAAVVGVAALFGVDIHGIAKEDAAEKSSPNVQVNTDSTVSNQKPTTTTPAATPPQPPPAPRMVSLSPTAINLIATAVAEKVKPKSEENTGV